jgi:hypothetical protein
VLGRIGVYEDAREAPCALRLVAARQPIDRRDP